MSSIQPSRGRDLVELILGYGFVVGVIWMPDRWQHIFSPIALVLTLSVVLARRRTCDELGLGARGFIPSLWILPAAVALSAVSVFVAARLGTLHPLYKADLIHISGYVLWTIYQQFLLQDYFMDRLLRLLSNASAAVILAGVLFAAAHLPNFVLTAATLVWGIVVMRAVPPLSQPLGARPGPGTARPLLRGLHSGRAASPFARRLGLFALLPSGQWSVISGQWQ